MATKRRTTRKSASTRAGVRRSLPKLPRKPTGALKAEIREDLVEMGFPVEKVRNLLRREQQADTRNRPNQAGPSTSQRLLRSGRHVINPPATLNPPLTEAPSTILNIVPRAKSPPSLCSILLQGLPAHDENDGLIVKDKGKGRAAESDSDPEEGTSLDQTSSPSLSSQGEDENADLSDPPTQFIGVKRVREHFEESAIRSSLLVDEGRPMKKARLGAR